MSPFGTTRSHIARNHALLAPDSQVRAPLAGWEKTQGVVLISPRLGAGFCQYLAFLENGSVGGSAGSGIERVVYVLSGRMTIESERGGETVDAGGYAFLPPGWSYRIVAESCRLLVFERDYVAFSGLETPGPVFGHERDAEPRPFLGDPGARLQTLLPETPAYDMAINLFTYDPGATLPFVEVHVMEHGLMMLDGSGIYRLDDAWYPVQSGDAIWMDAYCPQWFVAMGRTPARYIYYKDVNRDPLRTAR